jgi:hypothetical protein
VAQPARESLTLPVIGMTCPSRRIHVDDAFRSAAGALDPIFHILLSPWMTAAAMALSSIRVLANSLRLRARQPHSLGPALVRTGRLN